VPSVAYRDAGGVCESILDGVTGLLATDAPDLIAQVDRLLCDDDLRRDLGAKARTRSEQFSWDTTATTVAAALAQR
jgi:glycosyltransferase involved in cell wall biosynthesis